MAETGGELIGGRYRRVELIGQGGMGRVWRGRDETLGRDVAVKEVVFPQGITADQREVLLQRVLREARAAARLNHPGIITVHDVVEHAGAPVIVMEYVAGMSLATAIEQSGGLPARRVAEIGAAILRALGRAHAAGIIHRDLKPDNVLLMDDRVIITDFGIAHLVDSTTALTHTGTLIGTPAYMAPEQLSGQPPAPATDLWSLGATLYCAVEGVPPFSAETFTALCIAVVTGMPRPALRAEGLGAVLAALLTKDPAQRAGAAQALAALEGVARTGAAAYTPTRVDTPPGPVPEPPTPRPSAHATAAVTAGILALLTACPLVWFALYNVVHASGQNGRWSGLVWENVLGGVIGAGLLLVPARFTFGRRISGAWSLCALCLLYVVSIFLLGPLQGTVTFGAQAEFVLGFEKSNGVAVGLTVIFGTLTAITAGIAASLKSYGPFRSGLQD